jgi:multicomponent Na+:H+ antiporter subunit G
MLESMGLALVWLGVFFMVVTAIGVIRLPDFYSRLHAVSKTETLGLSLVTLGLGIYEGFSLVMVKLLLATALILITAPTAAHLLARAAVRLGIQPVTRLSEGPPAGGGPVETGRQEGKG